ncbi:MAG TPA: class I SAM-dependent methyltransferase [Acidimicrobiia bacterium]|nr:class I SAM-dependent methyltransferase [Acidimicrobiia bacterium]
MRDAIAQVETRPLPDHRLPFAGAGDVTDEDRGISALARSLPDLDRVVNGLVRRDPRQGGALLDLGCGMGGLAVHIGGRLGATELVGVDVDAERLKAAAARGVRPLLLDLNADELPLAAGSVRIVTCFGLLAYLHLYDHALAESARVLEDGGWLLLSMPNLGSYSNRISLLLGYQPHAVAVSRHRQAGNIGRRRDDATSANMPPLLHGATLRCIREVLDDYGFDTVVARGTVPGDKRRPVLDHALRWMPGLSRRFLVLARKRATPEPPC